MAQTYTINGVDYTFPDVDDSDWGQNVTDWAGAISSFLLQRTGGTFTLSAAVDFGTAFGLKVKELDSKTSSSTVSTDTSAFLRLAKSDYISWRNNVDGANLTFQKGTDDLLEFAGVDLVNLSATQTLTNKTLTSPVISGATLTGMTAIVFEGATADDYETTLTVTDPTADRTWTIPNATDTAVGKDTTDTLTNKTLTNPKMNEDVAMTTTSTYLNRMDATSAVQAQIDAKQATITGAATTIAGADLSVSKVLQSNGSGKVEASSVTTTTLGYLDASSSIQTQLNAKQATVTGAATTITGADLTASKVVQSNGAGKIEASSVTTTTLGYLDATSSIQTQIDTKAPVLNPNLTGYADFNTISAPGAPGTSGQTRLYSNAGKLYFHGNGGSETEIGAGGGGAGDADTIQLKTAEASEGTGSAPWYTGNDLVPGGGGSIGGTWELSTSNPLINTNDATKVFHYSNATTDRKGDYFEIELDVPTYAKGHNLVVQLFYRTVGAEDTDFLFFARDRTADYSTEANGVQSATNNVVVDSSTGFAVGDRICFEDSSNARHFRYVTAIPDGTHVTFSGAAAAFADNAAVVGKFFTDELNFIKAENNTTNYEGKTRRWAFQINDTTTKVRVGFLYDNSATSTNELFFDQILLSSNQFLQVSTQLGAEEYKAYGMNATDATTNTYCPYLASGHTEITNTISKYGTITNSPAYGWYFTAAVDCVVDLSITLGSDSGAAYLGAIKVPDATAITPAAIYDFPNEKVVGINSESVTGWVQNTSGTFKMSKGEDVLIVGSTTSSIITTVYGGSIGLVVTPEVSSAILLNSQDEIFTDWVDYTPTFDTANWADGGANAVKMAKWRRVGDSMSVRMSFRLNTGTVSSSKATIPIPDGYSIDISKSHDGSDNNNAGGIYVRIRGTSSYFNVDSYTGILAFTSDGKLNLSYSSADSENILLNDINHIFGSEDSVWIDATVPIAGWTSSFNPVLSMPLVDFGTFENTYSALITNSGTPAISTQSGNWLASVALDTSSYPAGVVTLTFTSGFFTVAPTVVVTLVDNGGNRGQSYHAASSTGVNVAAAISNTGNLLNSDFSITVQRQGSDYRQPPIATAAVIKPAVAIISNTQASYSYEEGSMSTSNTWYDRVLNTIKGESWFINSLSSNIFELQSGAYKVFASAPCFYVNDTKIRLYNTTDGITQIQGSILYVSNPYNGGGTPILMGSFTIGTSTSFRLDHYAGTGYSGTAARGHGGFGNAAGESVNTQIMIEKLK